MATLCGAKSPTRHAEGRKESPAISYESDFLPPVKNSRCGIVTHAARAADMGAARRTGDIHTENLSTVLFSSEKENTRGRGRVEDRTETCGSISSSLRCSNPEQRVDAPSGM